jgi:alpha-2-macroglobulin
MKDRRKLFVIGGILAAVLIIIGVILKLTASKAEELSDPAAYVQYISAYSDEIISRHDNITIQLNSEFAESIESDVEKLFDISPSINGETVWQNSNTVTFVPKKPLESGTAYTVRFKLNRLTKDIPKELRSFVFKTHTKYQDFDMSLDYIQTTEMQNFTMQNLYGTVRLLDYEPLEVVEQLISAEFKGKMMDVDFEDIGDNQYQFVVKNIERTSTESKVIVNYDGNAINIDKSGSLSYKVPSLDDFIVVDVKTEHFPEQHAVIVFSDPVREDQLLNGLINLVDVRNLKYIVNNNVVKIIPETRLEKTIRLSIYPGITNIHGKKLTEDYTDNLIFRMLNPELNKIGEGVILPTNTHGLVVPFKAVNIKAVDVRVIKIFENNILQFLQDNELSGNSDIKKVGKIVNTATIDLQLDPVNDINNWNTFNLDLAEIIEPDPGAIYRIEVGFRYENSLYPCEGKKVTSDSETKLRFTDFVDNMEWFTNYTYPYKNIEEDGYDYSSYNNPCSPNFYGNRRSVSFNVLATDLGIIAKKGKDDLIHVFITDLVSSKTLSGINVSVYDYQQQIIANGKTNRDGYAEIVIPRGEEAYFVVAEDNKTNQKNYLRINNYNSLDLANFEISGTFSQTGTTAFLFNERGVYRPGDSIYLSVIFREIADEVPEGHPVVLEFFNPRLQLVYREVQGKNENAFHVFRFKTDIEDITGTYMARITTGGQQFDKFIPVETIKPNRLSIDFNLDKKYLAGDGSVNADIRVKWLHGAVGKDLNTEVTMTLYRQYSPFENYEKYNFYNVQTSFEHTTSTIISGKTNDNGQLKTNVNFSGVRHAPGIMKAALTTKVFEKGGNFSISENSFDFYPYKNYVGLYIPDSEKYDYYLPPQKDIGLEIAYLDREGNKVQGTYPLELLIFELEYYWWYDYSEEQADFISSNYNNAILRRPITVRNGQGKEYFEIKSDGNYLVAVMDKNGGHVSSQRIQISSWAGGQSEQSSLKSNEMITISSDKDSYIVGEEVKISIPRGEANVLVSIENSGKVLKSFWEKAGKENKEIKFKVTEEMAPNVYVNITYIQPHSQTKNDRPMRLYGVIPVMVENPESILEPIIAMKDELEAEKTAKIKISEKNGKPMTYTLAMVDEGLLSLTNFITPDPWEFFYRKESLGVSTWDIYKFVIGMSSIEAGRKLAIGGDETINPEALLQAIRFKPMVRFIGPVYLPKGKENVHEIDMPQYVGAVRTMVVASEGIAYGNAEKTTPVKKPLMLLASAPRVIGTEEEMYLPLTVFAMDPTVKNVSISVKTNNMFSVIGGDTKNIKFEKEGDKFVDFKLKAANREGVGTIEVTAKSGVKTAVYIIEMNVRHPNPYMSEAIEIKGENAKFEGDFNAFGVRGTNSAYLEIYSIPPMNLEKRMQFLLAYPHGCIEQIVSGVFPLLYIDKLVEMNAKEKETAQENINRVIKTISRYQMNNGGFAYWPGGLNTNDWGTNYAGHFILEAEKAGYQIPANLKSNWLNYQRTRASKWTDEGHFSHISQAYRLYTLALAGNPDQGAMNRLRNIDTRPAAKWRLALAYSISGNKNTAKQLVGNLTTDVHAYNELSGSFGSDTRDKAMIIETLINLGEKEKAFLILREVAQHIGSERYASTQTVAYSLLAASKFINEFGHSGKIDCTYIINGKQYSASTNKAVFRTALDINETETNSITVNNNTDDLIYVRLVRQGVPEKGSEQAAESNIRMDVRYTYLNGNALNPNRIIQGTDILATVKLRNVSNISAMQNVALTQIFPSGWEIINQRLYAAELGEQAYYEYQDIRDDRVMTYFTLYKGNEYVFKFLLNASFPGKYYLPAVAVETMYDGSNYSRTKGQWVEVTKN